MNNKVIAIYPGRFQPFAKHHAAAFLWLQKQFGKDNTYIATSDKVELPKSPLNFKEKKAIINMYGFKNIVQVKNPYKAEEILSKFDPNTTAVVFMVGEKDMKEDPRFKIGTLKSGNASYFQDYNKNKDNMQGYDKHGYLIVAPHISLNVPGYGEMSGTEVRKALGDKTIPEEKKKEIFNKIFGWYSPKLANYMINKFSSLKETVDTGIGPNTYMTPTPALASGFLGDTSLTDIAEYHDADIQKIDMEFHRGIDIEEKRLGDADLAYKKVIKNLWKDPDYYTSNVHVDESSLTKKWWDNIIENILAEGGAAGHMAHPFDVDSVHTGNDLIDVFKKSTAWLEKGQGALKIDGVNASVRLVTVDNKKQFVLDRGSNKELDVKGITKQDLLSRFGEGHGMITIGGKVLDVFNASIPSIQSELKKLGLWDNPNIMFNVEYVAGTTNVLQYEKNFLAIHGLLEIVQVTPTRRASKEVSYSQKVLDTMIQKMQPIANKYKFNIYGSIPATFEHKPNLNSVLSKTYTIKLSKDKSVTKNLKSLLSKLIVPKDVTIDWKGKKVAAISKQVFVSILNGEPITENTKNIKEAIAGFITYLATMELGDEVLKSMTSPLGSVEKQEGVVIRDPSLSERPVKITGKFILQGLDSSFGK